MFVVIPKGDDDDHRPIHVDSTDQFYWYIARLITLGNPHVAAGIGDDGAYWDFALTDDVDEALLEATKDHRREHLHQSGVFARITKRVDPNHRPLGAELHEDSLYWFAQLGCVIGTHGWIVIV